MLLEKAMGLLSSGIEASLSLFRLARSAAKTSEFLWYPSEDETKVQYLGACYDEPLFSSPSADEENNQRGD